MQETVGTDGLVPDSTTPNVDPLDIAAREFQMGIPAFKKSLHNFSKKELIRIMGCVVESPLQDKNYMFQDKRSEKVVQLANHLIVCKMMMLQQVYKEKAKEDNINNEGETNV